MSNTNSSAERFWVQEAESDMPGHPEGWFGVVDAADGGIIAFFSTEEAAVDYRRQLIESTSRTDSRSRATRLFDAWNNSPERKPEDRYVSRADFEAALTEVGGAETLSDAEITDIVMQRARADMAVDTDDL